ncbi:histamine H2 receptor-like isoform X2 [Actinia tenebrosa]|uniref:Histamine H2 receptor-like isoform X2 n=1 Tax=Actinia tenebrosa TaxID=6105 RepID=A0A6P8I5C7_ACTTE|nr:histamine H2 receptor-like isoform X2 [Actinia tenebrosa]
MLYNIRMNGTNASSTAQETEIDTLYFTVKAIICVITVLGNALVIFLIIKSRRLRVLPNTFIVTLAIADMLVGAIITPTELACKYWNGHCDILLQRLTYDILYHLSATNLCALTLDRFIATVRPLKYPFIMTLEKVVMIELIAWISAGVTSFTSYTLIIHGLSYEGIQILDLVIFQILPSILLVIIYIRMTYVVTKLNKNQIQQINQISFNYGRTVSRGAKTSLTVKMTGVIIIVFISCYILAVGRRLYFLFTRKNIPYPVVRKMSRTLLNVNSAVNVFVYGLMKGDFKKELKRNLKCLYFYSNNNSNSFCEEHMEMRRL